MQDKVVKSKPQRMVRKQILITPEQSQRLKAFAEATGQSESEIIRVAIDESLRRHEAEEQDWKSGLRGIAGLWSDHLDLDRIMAEGRQRRAQRRKLITRRMRGVD